MQKQARLFDSLQSTLPRPIIAHNKTQNTLERKQPLSTEAPHLDLIASHVLFEQAQAAGTLRVCENDTHRWLDFGTAFTQTVMHRAFPARLELQYTQAMALALALNPNAERLLNLGAGCGTFERFFTAYLPAIEIDSVESEASVIRIAQDYFALPSEHIIQQDIADRFIQSYSDTVDIVLCDLHDGNKQPHCLTEPQFYQDLRRSMKKDGVLVINLLPKTERELVDTLKALRSAFQWQYLLDWDNIGNVLLFAQAEQPAKKSHIRERAMQIEGLNTLDFSTILQRLRLLPEAI